MPCDEIDRSTFREYRVRDLRPGLPPERIQPDGNRSDQRRVAGVDQPIELGAPKNSSNSQLGPEGAGVPTQRADRDVLDPATLDERHDVLAQACARSDVGLTPSQAVSQRTESPAKLSVVHPRSVSAVAHRALT